MAGYNLNTIYPNLNGYNIPFKSASNNLTSDPISKKDDVEQQRELASKECAYATKATAMAQILTGNDLKYTTTPEEYVNKLIKQGKIPNKDFTVDSDVLGNKTPFTVVKELNSDGKRVKETTFRRDNTNSDYYNEQSFFNPKYDRAYKGIYYKEDGAIEMWNYNILTEKSNDVSGYRADGSLEYYSDLKNGKGTHISKDGKSTEFNFKDETGNNSEPKYREYQAFIENNK